MLYVFTYKATDIDSLTGSYKTIKGELDIEHPQFDYIGAKKKAVQAIRRQGIGSVEIKFVLF